jgi:3-dehydroquinate synthase
MSIRKIPVRSRTGTYKVISGRGALKDASRELARTGRFSSLHIISSRRVWRAVGTRVLRSLKTRNGLHIHLMDDAEARKDLATVEQLCRSLIRAGADRSALLVAVGGGVVGDVAGYTAASYLRGVALAHVPTTLVAQTDSAIGGKTGVNLPEGKNLVGAFYPPRLVIADPQTLGTLPEREFRGGLAEVIKYGVIADARLFARLERDLEKAIRRDAGVVEYLVQRSAEIKASVVIRDERESGPREILNFGHTFGHALESVTNYRVYQHGEAVAWGMMAAALLGHEACITPARDAERIIALVRRMGTLPAWPRISPAKLIKAMRMDKKTRAGQLRFVLAPRIGRAAGGYTTPLELVERVLRFMPRLASQDAPQPERSRLNG